MIWSWFWHKLELTKKFSVSLCLTSSKKWLWIDASFIILVSWLYINPFNSIEFQFLKHFKLFVTLIHTYSYKGGSVPSSWLGIRYIHKPVVRHREFGVIQLIISSQGDWSANDRIAWGLRRLLIQWYLYVTIIQTSTTLHIKCIL